MIDFKSKNMKYSFKLLDICNSIQGSLSELSKNLLDKDKLLLRKIFHIILNYLKKKHVFLMNG